MHEFTSCVFQEFSISGDYFFCFLYLTKKLSEYNSEMCPSCFSHFHTSKSKKEASSEEVTTLSTIYQGEQWCDFVETTDATFAVITAAFVPTPP